MTTLPPELSVVEVVLQLPEELALPASVQKPVERDQVRPTYLRLGLQSPAITTARMHTNKRPNISSSYPWSSNFCSG